MFPVKTVQEYFETLLTEFSSEVELLAKIDHRNLVKLLGYLDKGNERLIITEYVPNGTLREHLDGKITDWKRLAQILIRTSYLRLIILLLLLAGMRNKILDFNQRLEISIDVAHALTYLHLYSGEHTFCYLLCLCDPFLEIKSPFISRNADSNTNLFNSEVLIK